MLFVDQHSHEPATSIIAMPVVAAPTAVNTRLLSHHYEHLRASTLTDQTIADAGVYSLADPWQLQRLLNWNRPADKLGACIVIPFRSKDGHLNGFARLRPDKPRTDGGKYEQPAGASNRAYFPLSVIDALNTAGATIGITEGEKKALAAGQAGMPCIGLTGVWNWQKARSSTQKADDAPREFIEDLATIDWGGRTIWICFDTDPRRNPSVNQALAELACSLTRAGATVVNVELPLGPPDEHGIPTKMAVDDYLLHAGPELFRELVERHIAAQRPQRVDVETYQEDLRDNRLKSLETRGVVYLDRSPTGSAKSTADIPAMIKAHSSLTVLATHRNCEEKERELVDRYKLNAAAYPKLDTDTCEKHQEALAVIASGLTVSGALCPSCEYKEGCEYLLGMKMAETADHRIATHKRAELCFPTIAERRRYIAVHEDPVTILRPMTFVSESLHDIVAVARHCRYQAMQWALPEAPFYWYLESAANFLDLQLHSATETADLELPDCTSQPVTADATLWAAINKLGIKVNGEAMRACKALASGHVASLCVRVDTILKPGAQPEIARSVLVVWRTSLPSNATVWISDATADPDEIRSISNLPVVDCTSGAQIVQRHPVLQIPVDIKKSTSQAVVLKTLRAVLAAYPDAHRIGVICDRVHLPLIKGTAKSGECLNEAERSRVAKVEYFRGGEGRGSNTWTHECDLLIVAGTPRVPPTVIKTRLIRRGKTTAAARSNDWIAWGPDYWAGRTANGAMRVVRTLAYRDRDWHAAYTSVVRAELQQSIGRGRSIRENGIPTVVLTNENLGVTLVDYELQTLNEFDEKVLEALRTLSRASDTFPKGTAAGDEADLSDTFPNTYILGKLSVKCMQIAAHLSADERAVRRSLNRLEKAGYAHRLGERSGWTAGVCPRQART